MYIMVKFAGEFHNLHSILGNIFGMETLIIHLLGASFDAVITLIFLFFNTKSRNLYTL